MLKMKFALLFILLGCSTMVFASINKSVTYDFTQMTLDIAPDVDWKDYTAWNLGYVSKAEGGFPPGWFGETLQEIAETGLYTIHQPDNAQQVLAVGLTHDNGASFIPSPVPASCSVQLKAGDTLYVSGVIHVPGKAQPAYIEDLNCHVG